MTTATPDRFSVPPAFWRGLAQLGIEPAAVLRQARLPAVLLEDKAHVTTAQYFELWRALEQIAANPGLGLAYMARLDTALLPASALVAYYSRNFRDGLARTARFRQLYTPQHLQISEAGDECLVTIDWPYTHAREPLLLTDVIFASVVELGRRGTGRRIVPRRVELAAAAPGGEAHTQYYGGPVYFGLSRNVLVLERNDLDLSFPGHNPELLALLTPALERALDMRLRQRTLSERIRAVLKRTLPGRRPDIAAVARELGTSERTLQRRITAEGTTFRDLLQDARRELARQLLREPETDIREVAYLLGFEDSNSFYRAFRSWEGRTPAQWREEQVRRRE